ncbi:hypothetical protein H8S90_10275 [Olivibacter sp. SDN3]|uniref:hypothetical protein n=1 Tax=Olivibacter sp. SDN3 TaxID=2764720 RepID=UPI001650F017|nr:hypothetical protein [Olivibacter sp. SDN3]QNL51924.1 hypothetical protein H8S90_10275 [Olivibacter sp. SDN3]
METLNRKIKTPLFLQELHGKEATVADLIFTYLTALVATGLIIYSACDINMSVFKFMILGLLAFDLSGGVIANFTQGTTDYYAESRKRRYVFIGLHFIQPIVMAWIFPKDLASIYLTASYTILATIVTSSLKEEGKQRVLAGFFATMGLSIVFFMSPESKVVHFMLVLFIVKLILAFSVKWHNTAGWRFR